MIPKIVHRIWFGDRPLPPQYERYWAAWQRQWPDHEFRTWRDTDVATLTTTASKIKEADGMPRKADIARYEILFRHGGSYLDCDVMPYQHFDVNALNSSTIVCNESTSDEYCSIGFIAAAPGAAIFEWAMHAINSRPLNKELPNRETGPYLFRQALAHGEHFKLQPDAFYPYLYDEPYSRIVGKSLSHTYGIHVWGGSWLTDQFKLQRAIARLKHGSVSESEDIAGMGPQGHALKQYCDSARVARSAALTAARKAGLPGPTRIANPLAFEFLKVCYYLVGSTTDALVWQIGAADGILVDPLRPLLVNFDLPAVLLEPNPYLFASLAKNYRNSKHCVLLNAALGAERGGMTLNAVNPAKSKERGLPDWVRGISSAYRDRNALGGLTIDADLTRRINECVEQLIVDVMDLSALLDAGGGRHPDIVVIDVEGMDGLIVEIIMKAGIRPRVLMYETQCLPVKEVAQLSEALSKEYISIPFGNDTVAYRRDLFFAYCDYLYIEEGYPTIHLDAIKFVMRT